MILTKEFLTENNVCQEGVQWFCAQTEVDVKKIIIKLINENKLDWANWLLSKLLSPRQRVQYAVFAAKQVLPLFEKEFPKDSRPRKAIEAAERVLSLKEEDAAEAAAEAASAAAEAAEEAARAAARAAVGAAEDAARAARAAGAAGAAEEAARAAARAAAWAAEAAAGAAWAARAAARAAAWAAEAAAWAAEAATMTRILEYGISLINN